MKRKRKAYQRLKRSKSIKINGKPIRSLFEGEVYKTLCEVLSPKASLSYESESLEYKITNNYKPDFIITLPKGKKFYIECKGYFKYTDRVKMQAVKESNPSLDIRLLFMRDSPSCLGKGSKTRPSEWAEANGFRWAVGEIPKEWFNE